MAKELTETIYARVPKPLMDEIRRRAKAEERTIAAVVARMIRHAVLCEHKVTVTDEL